MCDWFLKLLVNFDLFLIIWNDANQLKFLSVVLSLPNFDRVAVSLLREFSAGEPKLGFYFDIINLGAEHQVEIEEQVAGDDKAAEVAHQLLSVQVGHEWREAHHAVQHKHDNCFVQEFGLSLLN